MTYRFVVIEEKVKSQIFGSTGVKQVKMIEFCWQWSQNVHLVNTMKNQNSLFICEMLRYYGYAAKTVS